MSMAKKYFDLARVLAIIGGALMIVDAVLILIRGTNITGNSGFVSALDLVISAILVLVIGILVLISTGAVKSHKVNIGFNPVALIVLGILGVIFGGVLGGALVLIGAILLLF